MSGDFLLSINGFGSGFLVYIIPFLFVLTVVVFFHELGHFLVARWGGIKILTFSIGFGPELFGFNDRHGTRWKFAAIPLGGYVKFFGDDNAASTPDQSQLATMTEAERQVSFFYKPVGTRAAVVVAGPLANFLLAIVIFAGIFTFYGRQATSATVDNIQAGSPAAAAGFQSGDVVLSIDGHAIHSFIDMQRIVSVSPGRQLQVIVQRGDQQLTLNATPALREDKDDFGNVQRKGLLGISRAMGKVTRLDPLSALVAGVQESWFYVDLTIDYLTRVVTGRESADQLGGPARIAQTAGQEFQRGMIAGGFMVAMAALLNLAAVLSISIGLLNLFPIPLLDGGHLLFYAIEAVRRKPLSERTQEVGFRIGFALVMFLMIFATYNDRGVFHQLWKYLAS